MNTTGKMIALLGASCVLALANVAPAQAAQKPCCYNNGHFEPSTPKTCYRYGGQIVDMRYCYRAGYGSQSYRYNDYDYDYDYDRRHRRGPTFAIVIGDIAFGYTDGYFDRHRRWHRWRNDNERNWYRKHHGKRFHGMRRDDDRDGQRRDWRHGRRQNWD